MPLQNDKQCFISPSKTQYSLPLIYTVVETLENLVYIKAT